MATSQYTWTELRNDIVDAIPFANLSSSISVTNQLNRAAREVIREIDLRSTKRRAILASKVFDDVYSYAAPTDIKDNALIDVTQQVNRSFERLRWVNEQTFDMKKTYEKDMFSLGTDDLAIRLLLSLDAKDTSLTIASFDSTTADGGTWAVYSDATNITTDTSNYVQGGGSVKFDLTGSATTAGIFNSSLTTFDITSYVNDGSVFVWVYINSTTNLTNWILEIGNDTSNYYTQTVTATSSGTAFTNGWNQLRFDFASMTQTGSVTKTTCDHVRFYMTKSSGKSDDGYRVDHMSLHLGEYAEALYYSKYPWTTSAGVYIENSTSDTDLITADTDELELFVEKGKFVIFRDLRDYEQMKIAGERYEILKNEYRKRNPSERLQSFGRYYNPNLYRQ